MSSLCHPPRWQALRAEMRRALIAGLPLMGAQVLSIGNGLVDSLVAGRIDAAALGAVGIGAGLVFIVTLSSIGMLAALSPSMARLRGQGRRAEVGLVFRQGLWLALGLIVLDLLLLMGIGASIEGWGLDATLVEPLQQYLGPASWSIPGAVLLIVARNVCEATARTRPVLFVQIAALCINIVADLGLGLGMFGMPRLGIVGLGWSTTIVQTVSCLLIFALLRAPTFERFALFTRLERPAWAQLRPLLVLSAPICLMFICESGLFVATGLQAGMISTNAAGSHNIAIGVAAAFYMLPLGLSFALTARIGVALGRGASHGIRLRVASGVLLASVLACSTSIAIIVFRDFLAGLYTDDAEVRELAAGLLILAAVFQLSDALQATMIGLLRGLHDTRVPMLINLFAYWGIGFGVGYVSANHFGMGVHGLWAGLIAGLSIAAVLQGWRLVNRLRVLEPDTVGGPVSRA